MSARAVGDLAAAWAALRHASVAAQAKAGNGAAHSNGRGGSNNGRHHAEAAAASRGVDAAALIGVRDAVLVMIRLRQVVLTPNGKVDPPEPEAGGTSMVVRGWAEDISTACAVVLVRELRESSPVGGSTLEPLMLVEVLTSLTALMLHSALPRRRCERAADDWDAVTQ
jgi:hypothetical protein